MRRGLTVDRLCALHGIPLPVAEYRFSPPRRWRWDWAWPDRRIALDVNGGVWMQGKHSRGAGQLRDFEKWSEGAAQGWRVIHVTPAQVHAPATWDWLRRALGAGA